MTLTLKTGALIAALLVLGGCASASHRGVIAMPTPSPSDTAGQMMTVTGAGFTICDVSVDGPNRFDVTVCGSVSKARTAMQTHFPGSFTLLAYQPDDGGPHTPQELVMQWWINRITGPGFTITMTQIMDDGTINVGVGGDLKAARAVLDRAFPGWTRVHAQSAAVPLIGNAGPG